MSLLGSHGQWTGSLTSDNDQSPETLVTHLATLMIDTGPGCQEDVSNDQVTLPAGREQGRPHPAVNTVHIRPIQQQNLDRWHF